MAITTITQLPELPLQGQSQLATAKGFMIPIDATVAGTSQSYKMGLSAVRDFVLNSAKTYNVDEFTTDTQDLVLGIDSGVNVGIGKNPHQSYKLDVLGNIQSSNIITAPRFQGNADTAEKLRRNFTITLGGVLGGSVQFDGTTNVNFNASINSYSVLNSDLATDSVDTRVLTKNSVITENIVDGDVTTAKIKTQNITTDKIKDYNVTNVKIANASIYANQKLVNKSVDNAKMGDSNVHTRNILNKNVINEKIGDNQVDARILAAGSIIGGTGGHIRQNTVQEWNLNTDSVNARVLAGGSINTSHINNDQVTSAKLAHVLSRGTGSHATYYKEPAIQVNDQGQVYYVTELEKAIRRDGSVGMTNTLTLKSGSNKGIYFPYQSDIGDTDDFCRIHFRHDPWNTTTGAQHALHIAVGNNAGTQSKHSKYHGDLIVLETPSMSGLKFKTSGSSTLHSVYHTGQMPGIITDFCDAIGQKFFTHFYDENHINNSSYEETAAANSQTFGSGFKNTLILRSKHVTGALGYTPYHTRGEIISSIGYEPVRGSGVDIFGATIKTNYGNSIVVNQSNIFNSDMRRHLGYASLGDRRMLYRYDDQLGSSRKDVVSWYRWWRFAWMYRFRPQTWGQPGGASGNHGGGGMSWRGEVMTGWSWQAGRPDYGTYTYSSGYESYFRLRWNHHYYFSRHRSIQQNWGIAANYFAQYLYNHSNYRYGWVGTYYGTRPGGSMGTWLYHYSSDNVFRFANGGQSYSGFEWYTRDRNGYNRRRMAVSRYTGNITIGGDRGYCGGHYWSPRILNIYDYRWDYPKIRLAYNDSYYADFGDKQIYAHNSNYTGHYGYQIQTGGYYAPYGGHIKLLPRGSNWHGQNSHGVKIGHGGYWFTQRPQYYRPYGVSRTMLDIQGKTTMRGPGTGSWNIDQQSCALMIGPGHRRWAYNHRSYYPGIGFGHLTSHSQWWDTQMHCWIGMRLYDTPSSERSNLVFATTTSYGGLHSQKPTEKMCIDPYGRVGIGTKHPQHKLEVKGTIKADAIKGGAASGPNLIDNAFFTRRHFCGNDSRYHGYTWQYPFYDLSGKTGRVKHTGEPHGFRYHWDANEENNVYRSRICIQTVHPYYKGFEGPYRHNRGYASASTPDHATFDRPYYYGRYYKGRRVSRGGLADGWAGTKHGRILRIAGRHDWLRHTGFRFPVENQNVMNPAAMNRVRFTCWIKIVRGNRVSFGTDAGYRGTHHPNAVYKSTTDRAADGWYKYDRVINISHCTTQGSNFLMGVRGDPHFEVLIAMPSLRAIETDQTPSCMPSIKDTVLANVLANGENGDAWNNGIKDSNIHRVYGDPEEAIVYENIYNAYWHDGTLGNYNGGIWSTHYRPGHSSWYWKYMIEQRRYNYGTWDRGIWVDVPEGYNTVWIREHANWQHLMTRQLNDSNQMIGNYSPRWAASARRGGQGAKWTPTGSTNPGWYGIWWGHQWTPIPVQGGGRVFIRNAYYSDWCWWSGLAFTKNPWGRAANSSESYVWNVNGGHNVWWHNTRWYHDRLMYVHHWYWTRQYVPVIRDGKDKMLYWISHNDNNWNHNSQMCYLHVNGHHIDYHQRQSVMNRHGRDRWMGDNGFGPGVCEDYDNPIKRHYTSQWNGYMAVKVPGWIVNQNGGGWATQRHGGSEGGVGTMRVDFYVGGHQHFYFREAGTHNCYPHG